MASRGIRTPQGLARSFGCGFFVRPPSGGVWLKSARGKYRTIAAMIPQNRCNEGIIFARKSP